MEKNYLKITSSGREFIPRIYNEHSKFNGKETKNPIRKLPPNLKWHVNKEDI